MKHQNYKLRFLPIFEDDLNAIVDYIVNTLKNVDAANRLIDDVECAILKRLETPLSFPRYQSKKQRPHDYYRINVRNFSIFYVVIENTMEVRRIMYNKRDIDNIL